VLIIHFSTLALICVGLLGISGVYSAILRIGSLPALFNTPYGQALWVKLGLATPLVGLGAINLLIISPRLQQDRLNGASNLRMTSRFGKIILGEMILACIVLLSASMLSYLPPPQMAATSTDLKSSAEVDDLKFELTISPGRVGVNTFTLQVASDGKPVQTVKEVLLRFTPRGTGLPPAEVQLIGKGNGFYSARGTYLSLQDTWQIQAVVRRDKKFDAFTNFSCTVYNPSEPELSIATARVAGGLTAAIGLMFSFLVFSLARKFNFWYIGGGLFGAVLFGLGIVLLALP
jgi:copper transport protein